MRDVVLELLATEVALDKLGARGISADTAVQLLQNDHTVVANPRTPPSSTTRRLLVGHTDGGRILTLVLEQTIEPATWLIVTGWDATETERKILRRR